MTDLGYAEIDKVDGDDEIYIGNIFTLERPDALDERNITSVLSVVAIDAEDIRKSDGGDSWADYGQRYRHMVIEIEDFEESNLLIHLPGAVRFIEDALRPSNDPGNVAPAQEVSAEAGRAPIGPSLGGGDETTQGGRKGGPINATATPTGAVYVHCLMGISRSVSMVMAYLMWKYPQTISPANHLVESRGSGAEQAVLEALKWVRKTRDIASPNRSFMKQLKLWWEMGCPADVEMHPTYQSWLEDWPSDNSTNGSEDDPSWQFV